MAILFLGLAVAPKARRLDEADVRRVGVVRYSDLTEPPISYCHPALWDSTRSYEKHEIDEPASAVES